MARFLIRRTLTMIALLIAISIITLRVDRMSKNAAMRCISSVKRSGPE